MGGGLSEKVREKTCRQPNGANTPFVLSMQSPANIRNFVKKKPHSCCTSAYYVLPTSRPILATAATPPRYRWGISTFKILALVSIRSDPYLSVAFTIVGSRQIPGCCLVTTSAILVGISLVSTSREFHVVEGGGGGWIPERRGGDLTNEQKQI